MQMTPFNRKNAIGLHGSGVVKSVRGQNFDQRRQGVGRSKLQDDSPMLNFITSLGVSADALGQRGMSSQDGTHVQKILKKLDPSLSADAANHAALPAEYRKKENEEKDRRMKSKI